MIQYTIIKNGKIVDSSSSLFSGLQHREIVEVDGLYRLNYCIHHGVKLSIDKLTSLDPKTEIARITKLHETGCGQPTRSLPGYLRTRYRGLNSAASSRRHKAKMQLVWLKKTFA